MSLFIASRRFLFQSRLRSLASGGVLLGLFAGQTALTAAPASPGLHSQFGCLPLAFEANRGQSAPNVGYVIHGNGCRLTFAGDAADVSLCRPSQPVLHMTLAGASPHPTLRGEKLLPGHVNFLAGSDAKRWITNVPIYSAVRYSAVYPGVDLLYYGHQGRLEYDFVVAPGSDPNAIRVAFKGASSERLDNGNLFLRSGTREVCWQKPQVYQWVSGRRCPVAGAYTVSARHQVGFQIGRYDRTKPLVIDPSLVYSTYLEGGGGADGKGIAVDAAGDTYVVGETGSSDFPTTPGAFQTSGSGIFVTKFNASGTALIYSTFLGDGGTAGGICVDSQGDAYITGSGNFGYPTTPGAYSTAGSGGFVTKLNASGSGLIYSTNFPAQCHAIAIDRAGEAFVTGVTLPGLPVTSGVVEPSFGNGKGQFPTTDAFVAKFNRTGSALVYSTYLGGSSYDAGNGIAVDLQGNAFVTGYTESEDFPLQNPVQSSFPTNQSMFVSKLNPTGSSFVYSTYLAGFGGNFGFAVAADDAGNAYVAGDAAEQFPTTPGALYANGEGPVAVKLTPAGALAYSTFLTPNFQAGGSLGIAVDKLGRAFVTGYVEDSQFPTTPGAFEPVFGGESDAFVVKLDPSGEVATFSSYLGGNQFDTGSAIATDGKGNAYVTGNTYSRDFPVTPGAFETTNASGAPNTVQGFVTEVNTQTPLTVYLTAPSSGQVYYTGDTVFLTAKAVDDFGTVSAVSFYANGALLSTSTARPYSFQWAAHPVGTYTVTARAVDSSGAAAVSAPLTLTFVNPLLSSLYPSSITVGSPGQSITVSGEGFEPGSVVTWNGVPLSTSEINSTYLSVQVPAADFAVAGYATVQVINPESDSPASNTAQFAVLNPIPSIYDLTPRYVKPGQGSLSLGVIGGGFISATTVLWNNQPLATHYVSASQLTAQVPAALVSAQGVSSVTVSSPGPGGGSYGVRSFLVDGTAPTTSISFYGDKNGDGSYAGPTQGELQALDNNINPTVPGSGVAATYYSIDGGLKQTYISGSSGFTISTVGFHTISYYSIDNVGNTEPVHTTRLRIVPPVTITGFTFAPATGSAGADLTGTVTLSGPAPVNGPAYYNLTSDNQAALSLPFNTSVNAGQTQGTFTAYAVNVTATTVVTVTASFDGSSRSARVTVTPPPAATTPR